jgi:hypothetical protein
MNQGASFLVQQQESVEADKGSDVKIATQSCKETLATKNIIWLKKKSQIKKLTGDRIYSVLPFSSPSCSRGARTWETGITLWNKNGRPYS